MNLISNANAKVHLFFGIHSEVYDIFKKIKLVLCQWSFLHSILLSLSGTSSLILAPRRIELISHGEGNLGCRILVIYQFFQLTILANGVVVIGAK